jgi:hypothetical protein
MCEKKGSGRCGSSIENQTLRLALGVASRCMYIQRKKKVLASEIVVRVPVETTAIWVFCTTLCMKVPGSKHRGEQSSQILRIFFLLHCILKR